MKTIFTFLLATLIATSAFAYDEGRLTISFAGNNNNLQVVVDNRSYSARENTVVLNNIRPGNHTIRIYRQRKNGRSSSRNELLYSTTVNVRPAYHVDVMVNRFGKALVDEQALRDLNRWDDRDDYGRNDNYYDDYNQTISTADFNQLVQRIKSQWFSSAKVNTAKEGISQYYFNTAQVKEMLQLFSTDSDKLELAKLAYRRTANRQTYYQVGEAFSFQSTRDELDRYIRENRF